MNYDSRNQILSMGHCNILIGQRLNGTKMIQITKILKTVRKNEKNHGLIRMSYTAIIPSIF